MVTWTSELHLNAPCACLRKTWHFLHWFNSIFKVINASPTVREACTSVTVQSTRAASMFLFLPPTFWSHPWPLSFFSDYNPSEVEILFGLRLGNGLAGCAGYLRFSKNSHSCLSNKNREEKNKKKLQPASSFTGGEAGLVAMPRRWAVFSPPSLHFRLRICPPPSLQPPPFLSPKHTETFTQLFKRLPLVYCHAGPRRADDYSATAEWQLQKTMLQQLYSTLFCCGQLLHYWSTGIHFTHTYMSLLKLQPWFTTHFLIKGRLLINLLYIF